MKQNRFISKDNPSYRPNTGIRAVAFDCDGVMFDTTRANTAFYNHLLGHFNRPPLNDIQVRFIQMHTVIESVHYLFGEDRILEKKAQAFRETIDYKLFINEMEMEPDLLALLRYLKPLYKTGIATNRMDTMAAILEAFNLANRFDTVVCALDVERPKPQPDELVLVLERLALMPHQMVYIGDSDLDEEAAKAAGVHFIAYRNPELSSELHAERLWDVKVILETRMDGKNE